MLGIEELKGRVFQRPPTPKSPPPPPRERKLPSLKPSAMAHHHERKLHAKLSSLLLGLADSLPSPLPKSPTPRSPRTFDGGGAAAVGLAIVAAGDRAEPASIVSARAGVKWERPTTKEMEMEMSESYTCVISHVGGRPPSKRVYFDGGDRMFDPVAPPPLAAASVSDFLSCCGRCRKKLHGLDIFMYKGDKAFCSVECRYQQILSDEHMEQCGPGTMKAFDKSASPCPATLLFAPGVTAV